MGSADYRRRAREALRGKWLSMWLVMLAALALICNLGLDRVYKNNFSYYVYWSLKVGSLELTFTKNLFYLPKNAMGWVLVVILAALWLIQPLVQVGRYRAAGAVVDGQKPALRQLFPKKLIWKALWMNIVFWFLVGLQFLLLIVPGLIAIYRYGMADYLLAENPEMGPIEALRESRKRMKGHKGACFCLDFSFFGWILLASAASIALQWMVDGATIVLDFIFVLLSSAALNAYVLTARTLFFRGVLRGEAVCVDAHKAGDLNRGADVEPESGRRRVPPDASETMAKDMFFQYGCSRRRMEADGVLEEYAAMGASDCQEERWRRAYGDGLMRRFDRESAALNDLILLAEEYGLCDLIDRALERIDRHIRQETLPDAEILSMCGRTLAAVCSGAFDENAAYVARKRDQISGLLRRLEANAAAGDGREAMGKIRRR